MTQKTLSFWGRAIKQAHSAGRPNGWLLGWDPTRYFREFATLVRPHEASNWTSFDYSYCNQFAVEVDVAKGPILVLTVWLSFIAPAASMHWTEYSHDRKRGLVLNRVREPAAQELDIKVRDWIERTGFELVSGAMQATRFAGVNLELSEPSDVTVGKCLFMDYDG